jgi:hypothetical protein
MRLLLAQSIIERGYELMEIRNKYLTAESVQEGDLMTILDEGSYSDMEYKGKKRQILNFNVNNGTYDLVYSPGTTAQKELIKAWGKETKNWIGKKFQVKLLDQLGPQGLKKVIYPEPIKGL